MWEPRSLRTLWSSTVCYRDSFLTDILPWIVKSYDSRHQSTTPWIIIFELPETLQNLKAINLTFYQKPASPPPRRIQSGVSLLWDILEGTLLSEGRVIIGVLGFIQEAVYCPKF
jgi:hypothetical protein